MEKIYHVKKEFQTVENKPFYFKVGTTEHMLQPSPDFEIRVKLENKELIERIDKCEMLTSFPIQAVGDNILIDPMPNYKPSDLIISSADPVKEMLASLIRDEGVIIAVGANVKNYKVGDKVYFRGGAKTIFFYEQRALVILVEGNILLKLPNDYELQNKNHTPKIKEYSPLEPMGSNGQPKNKYAKPN